MFEFLSKLEFKEVFFTFMFLGLTAASVYTFVGVDSIGDTLTIFWLVLPEYIASLMSGLFPFSFFLSLVLVLGIVSVSLKISKNRQKLSDALAPKDPKVSGDEESADAPPQFVNEKWQKVIIHINSENMNDWKLAILECDIMLGDILEKMGYMQESIGEKLKSVEPSDFTNIEAAWEAHKIRNAIAHEGSDFLINHREAKRVIGLYELVFREFAFI